ncbi:MAG: threonylcarbamoyl-AMP synthase [Bacteroidales bacterium]|nr:threonylcarbamoyl-AMP synthase [Bacteroidales bacterium]
MKTLTDTLKAGGLILYPTDTIWGIGCDATSAEAVAKVYALKKREDSKSLVILVSDADMLARYVKAIPDVAQMLMEVNDAPMTIIYPEAEPSLASNCISEDGSIAIRIPQNEFCVNLIRRFGRPIVSTSANISGEPSPKCFEEIAPAIVSGVDCVASREYDNGGTHKASQIIKVEYDGQIKIIRQ